MTERPASDDLIERCTATISGLQRSVENGGNQAKLVRAIVTLIGVILTRFLTLFAEWREGARVPATPRVRRAQAKPASPSQQPRAPRPTRKPCAETDFGHAERPPLPDESTTQAPIATPKTPKASTHPTPRPAPISNQKSAAWSVAPDIPPPRFFHRPSPNVFARPNRYDIKTKMTRQITPGSTPRQVHA